MLVSTFQRVDLAIIRQLTQYNVVLYTDADVFFRRRISMNDFGGWRRGSVRCYCYCYTLKVLSNHQ